MLAAILIFGGATIISVPNTLGEDVLVPTGDSSADLVAALATLEPQPAATLYALIGTPAAATPTPKPTAKPTPKPYRDTVWNARRYAKSVLGPTQYKCIDAIFTRESHWDPRAKNPRSGAYGIPQALPGSKMRMFGRNWRYSPLIQVKWGIWYVKDRYGSACKAYDFMKARGWY
jgi:hypothetical protein